jgi:hypothetical protein
LSASLFVAGAAAGAAALDKTGTPGAGGRSGILSSSAGGAGVAAGRQRQLRSIALADGDHGRRHDLADPSDRRTVRLTLTARGRKALNDGTRQKKKSIQKI